MIDLPRARTFAAATTASLALAGGVAIAQTTLPRDPSKPCPGAAAGTTCGDNYLDSTRLNEDGTRLERNDTLTDNVNTATATTQAQLMPGGSAEPTTCGSTRYGRTIWYDFYPDINGIARLRATGVDSVVSVMPFSRRTSAPDLARRQCFDRSKGPLEEVFVEVAAKRAYTVQIGAANSVGGPLLFQFDFLADRDADGTLDEVDGCPTLPATRRGGCPATLRARPRLAVRPTPTGVSVVSLTVRATRGARVEAACTRGCRKQVRKRTRGRASFSRIRGRALPAGAKLVIRATRKGRIGAYVSYKILRGNIGEPVERCMNPGSRKPRRRCR